VPAAHPGAPDEAELRTADIAFYERRTAADPQSSEDRATLAALYLQRGRETGAEVDFVRAERAALQSLVLRTTRNGKTFVTLAAALLAQHQFTGARRVAGELVAREPDAPAYRALLGETQVELGDYVAARRTFATVDATTASLSIAPRLARWAELNGRLDLARRLLRGALADAELRDDLPREQLAWFYLRVGDFELRNGRPEAAARALKQGLTVDPNDGRVLSTLARLAAVRGRWPEAVEWGERAIAVRVDPATLGLLSDAHAALGDSASAAEYARALEVSVSGQSGPYHRAWGLFLLDHDRRVAEVLARARVDVETRRDVYGYDLLAWALHKAGRDDEAQRAMTQALRLGTPDAGLYFHAGMIERALGDRQAARAYLERALAANPWFHPTQPAIALQTLDSLRRPDAAE
jgi:tetratricopeptide (TPR) repeat protein